MASSNTFSLSARTVSLSSAEGKVVFESDNVIVPATWSDTAATILCNKYFRKSVPFGPVSYGAIDSILGDTPLWVEVKASFARATFDGHETSVMQTVGRLVTSWCMQASRRNYSNAFVVEMFVNLMTSIIEQRAAPNSPQWFNSGLNEAYGITFPSVGQYTIAPQNNHVNKVVGHTPCPQVHACFIQSVSDTLVGENGIIDLVAREARLFKYGSGSGTNFSPLRGRGEPLAGGGTSSGLISWLRILNEAGGAIKSGGTTRRAAKMVCLDIDHPDVEELITWKSKEELKAKALIAAGYNASFEGEAYATVSGQNSNNSIRVSDEFMNAVKADADWNLTRRTDGGVSKTLKARYLWDLIAKAAWDCADPGLQYDTTINKWHTCPNEGRINASNPCSEYMFLDDTACNLASIKLTKFSDSKSFAVSKFVKEIDMWTRVLDLSVDMASYPSESIARRSMNFRTIGLGYADLGALLMDYGIPYESEEGYYLGALLTSLMTGGAYATSAKIAKERGTPFPGFEANKKDMMNVISMHHGAHAKLGSSSTQFPRWDDLYYEGLAQWGIAVTMGNKYGFSNAQTTVVAPTGTIGFIMDCGTTGIEPDFSLVKYKKMVGGAYVKLVNEGVASVLIRLGYTEAQIADIKKHIDMTSSIKGSPHIADAHLPIFYNANEISYVGHIEMMAAVQPFLSGAISKTVNLPFECTVAQIGEVYMHAWEKGVKAVALYRDNCKGSQPLNNKKEEQVVEVKPVESFVARKKLPTERRGRTYALKVHGQDIFLHTGEYSDGTLGEIFVDMYKSGSPFRSMLDLFAISVSIGLQHGVPLHKLVEKYAFTEFEPRGIVTGHSKVKSCTSVIDTVFRILAVDYLHDDRYSHVKNDVDPVAPLHVDPLPASSSSSSSSRPPLITDGPLCKECGYPTIRNGTCYKCENCGTTTGCS